MRDFKKCDITYLLRKIDLEMLPHLKIASGSFIYYVINVYVPRVKANAYHMLTTPETPKCAYVIYGQPLIQPLA